LKSVSAAGEDALSFRQSDEADRHQARGVDRTWQLIANGGFSLIFLAWLGAVQ